MPSSYQVVLWKQERFLVLRPLQIEFFRNLLDKGVELEEVAKKVIGSTEVQNKARVGRNQYRKVLGIEYLRELILK